MPTWIEQLEGACFGQAWGPLGDAELIWAHEAKGFARWSAYPALGEAELLRIAVVPDERRTGVARALLRASVRGLRELGIRECHLEVRLSNDAGRALYESEGWIWVGTRKGYYQDGESAALYLLRL